MDIMFTDGTGQQYQLRRDTAGANKATIQNFNRAREALSFINKLKITRPARWDLLYKELEPHAKPILDKHVIKEYLAEALVNKQFYLQHYQAEVAEPAMNIHGSSGGGQSQSASLGPASTGKPVSSTSAPSSEQAANNQTAVTDANPSSVSDSSETGAAPNNETETRGCPISMVSGEEVLPIKDTVLPGPMPFVWKRFYRTGHRRDSGLGHGWTHSAGERLQLKSQTVVIYDDEGRQLTFKRPMLNQRSKLINEGMDLDCVSANCFILKHEKSWDKVFTRLGESNQFRLTQIRHSAYQPEQKGLHAQTEQGFAINLYYDAHDSLSKIEGNWGKSFYLKRDVNGRVTAITLKNEQTKETQCVAEYDYNEQGDLIAHRNVAGVGETYDYKNHLIQQRTLVTGFSYYYQWDGEDSRARCIRNWGDDGIYDYSFKWDPDNNASCATDSRGYTTTFIYNDFGQIEQEIDPEGGVHRYQYENGRKIAYTNPEGHTTRYFYSVDNQPAGYRDALGHSEIVSYFKGKPTRFKDKSGIGWQREYNAQGQLVKHIDPYGKATRYRYNANGLIKQITDPFGHKTVYDWNEQGQLLKIVDSQGNTQQFVHDAWGQITERHVLLKGQTDPSITRYTYTKTGQIEKLEHPNGEQTHYQYNTNNQLTAYTDAQGRTTQFEYDGLSQVVKRIHANGTTLQYRYDKERNLKELINENGDAYRFEYDGCERLIKETGFDGRTQHYKYNKAGQLIKHLDAGRVMTEFERDALGQMLTKTSTHRTDKTQKQQSRYLYDKNGRLTETYNEHQYLTFKYDKFGNLVNEHHCDLEPGKTARFDRILSTAVDIGYQTQWPGIRSGLTLPDGQQIDYQFDELRLKEIQLNGNIITQIHHDAFGRETARQQGSLTTQTDYDPMGRLIKQQAVNQASKQNIIQRDYAYDQNNNLSYLKDGNVETHYLYDELNRLKQTTGNIEEQFDFDPAGNIVSIAEQNQHENKNAHIKGNRLTLQGDKKFEYDERGNLIKEARGKGGQRITRYKYNLQNQLTGVNKEGQITEYKYDPLGRRIEKKDAFGTTRYLWAENQMVQESRNSIKKTYVYEPHSFKPVALVQDEQIYHYHLDHLGTPRELTNDEGQIVWKVRYKTYGNVALKEVDEIENNIRFQGQYFDEESGLHYNRHRYYNPSSGQFITQDPIGLLGGLNNYQYAPNPTGWVDPLGLTAKEGDCGVAIIRQYENGYQEGHLTIEIIDGDISYHTDQVITSDDKSSTTIRRSNKAFEGEVPVAVVEIPIPNAEAARNLQKQLINENLGEYDAINNSCVSHVCDILEAGGHKKINRHELSYAKFYKRNGLKRLNADPLPRWQWD